MTCRWRADELLDRHQQAVNQVGMLLLLRVCVGSAKLLVTVEDS